MNDDDRLNRMLMFEWQQRDVMIGVNYMVIATASNDVLFCSQYAEDFLRRIGRIAGIRCSLREI